jgi:hypothetical protein
MLIMGFLTDVETAILGQLSAVESAAFKLASDARPAFIAGLVIWIALTGYEVAFGKTQDRSGSTNLDRPDQWKVGAQRSQNNAQRVKTQRYQALF